MISCARLRKRSPSSVSVVFLLLRTNSCTPSSSSSSCICRESVGCVTKSTLFAAAEKLSCSATAKKYLIVLSSIRINIVIMPKRYGRTVDMPKLFLNEGDVPRAIQLFEQLMFPNGFQHRHLRNGNLVQFLQAFRLRNAVVNQYGIQRFHV